MKERPILFQGAMVRALLDGSETQTRRIVKPQPSEELGWSSVMDCWRPVHRAPPSQAWKCPYGQPGDRLIVASEIPGVPRTYCAGSDGTIYSRARGTYRPLRAHGNKNGYLCVTIMDGARKTTRAVHSLVCAAFYGPSPFDGAQVRHLNGNPERCEPANLAWGTQAKNWSDRRAHGNGIEGEKHHNAKLSDVERGHLRWAIERGLCSQRHAARTLGMSQGAMGGVMAGGEIESPDQDIPLGRIPFILLEIVSVRVERLNDITLGDICKEGLARSIYDFRPATDGFRVFTELWELINGAGSWSANPFVWVVEFKRVPA